MAGEDDDDSEVAGPPPDPSMRAWRHPSEIAAANAAAAATKVPPRRPRWSPLSFGVGGVLGAMIALAAMASMTDAFDDGPTSRVEFRTSTGGAPDVFGEETMDDAGDGAAEGDTGDDETPDASSATTTLTIADTTDVSAASPDPIEIPGVFTLYQLDGDTPVATAVLIDDLLLTSATALGGAERVTIIEGGDIREAVVQGMDRFTDVAVLVPTDPFDADPITPAAENGISGDHVRLVATDGQPAQIIVAGRLISTDESATTRDGHPVIGTMLTSARVPKLAGGAALVNENNEAIGLVIDTDDYLAVAVPLSMAREIGQSILETGRPHPAWIGIQGNGDEDGVVITDIGESSPAALAGLTIDDRLVSINDYPVSGMVDIVFWTRTVGPGGILELQVVSGEEMWMTTVTIGERPPAEADRDPNRNSDG